MISWQVFLLSFVSAWLPFSSFAFTLQRSPVAKQRSSCLHHDKVISSISQRKYTKQKYDSMGMVKSSDDRDECHRSLSVQRRLTVSTLIATVATMTTYPRNSGSINNEANAAPPIAIIAEELGYFPVTNRFGETVYIPANVRRKSTEQSILLASHLKEIGAKMYGAYWCPHCQNQKETFGKEAWGLISYIECSAKGYGFDAKKVWKGIEGFPTWTIPVNQHGKIDKSDETIRNVQYSIQKDNAGVRCYVVSGELPLIAIAKISGFDGFDQSQELNIPKQVSC